MLRTFVFVVQLTFLISAAGLNTFSQQQPPSKPDTPVSPDQNQDVVRVGTKEVHLEAIVTDKSGRRITRLTTNDFEVLDEGRPQALQFFTETGAAQTSSGDANKGTQPEASTPLVRPFRGRYVALVIDDLSLSNENFLRSRGVMGDYIKSKLADTDLVAMISTAGSLGSLQQFTNDRSRLLQALNRMAAQPDAVSKACNKFHLTPAEAVRIDSGDNQMLQNVMTRAANESLANELNTSGSVFGSSETAVQAERGALENQIRGEARCVVGQMGAKNRNLLYTLRNLFRGMADLPGRKIVVLVTETFSTLANSKEDVSNQVLEMIELARRSGVSVYAVDAAGLRTNSVTASERITGVGLTTRASVASSTFTDFENLGAARSLVAGTGGELIANTNDLAVGLDRALEDSADYYVIGFKPSVLDNKFHRLTVTIKGRSDLIVRTRRGYLAVNEETVAGTTTELAAVLISPVPRIELPLEVVVNVVPKSNEQIVMTGFHVGRNYLTMPGADLPDKKAVYDFLAWIFAVGRDRPLSVIDRVLTYDLTNSQALQKLKTEGVVLVDSAARLNDTSPSAGAAPQTTLPPGMYQIRAVVRERTTGAIGSAYQFFEIPAVAERKVTSMSSLVLSAAGQTGFSGMYSFKRGTEIDLRYAIYNLPTQTAGISQQVKLVDAQGRTLMDSPLSLAPAGAAGQAAMQATRLNVPNVRGRYGLIVTLRDAKDRINVERRADFVVE